MLTVFDQYHLLYEGSNLVGEIRQYMMTVFCVVALCGLVQMILSSGVAGSLVKLLCGLIVTVTVLQPLIKDYSFRWKLEWEDLIKGKEKAIAGGEEYAAENISNIITQRIQTYILEKASALGTNVDVAVQVQREQPYLPKTVEISGTVSPYAKQQLMNAIEAELGISKEEQIWIS